MLKLKNRVDALRDKILTIVGDGVAVIFLTADNRGLLVECDHHGKGCPSLPCEVCESCHRAGKNTIILIDDIGVDDEES